MSILEDFARDMAIRGMTARSQTTYLWCLADVQKFIGDRPVQDLKRADLKAYVEYLRDKGLNTKTIDLRLAALSSFYDYLIFEEIAAANPVKAVRKRYLQVYKTDSESHTCRIISVDEAASLVNAAADVRDKAMILVLLKTGVRRNELIAMDVMDIDLPGQTITLKANIKKRSNRVVFFDDETGYYLRRWLKAREMRAKPGEVALWIGPKGRLGPGGINKTVREAAMRVGLHDTCSHEKEDHFSPHCCRHWFTTRLLETGMPREYIKEVRGDVRREAIDVYHHISREELRKSYLAHMPQLGV